MLVIAIDDDRFFDPIRFNLLDTGFRRHYLLGIIDIFSATAPEMEKEFALGSLVILKAAMRFDMLFIKTGKDQDIIIDKTMTELLDTLGGSLDNRVLATIPNHAPEHALGEKTAKHGHLLVIHPLLFAVIEHRRRSETGLVTGFFQGPSNQKHARRLACSPGHADHDDLVAGEAIDQGGGQIEKKMINRLKGLEQGSGDDSFYCVEYFFHISL